MNQAVSPGPVAFTRELDATFLISKTLNSAKAHHALREVSETLLSLPGLTGVQFRWQDPSRQALAKFGRAFGPVSAVAPVGTLGEVRIHLDIDSLQVESPARLAAFVGQQLFAFLERVRLTNANATLSKQQTALSTELATRKVIHRAVGVLAAKHRISTDAAWKLLQETGQQQGGSLRQLAENLIQTPRPLPARPLMEWALRQTA